MVFIYIYINFRGIHIWEISMTNKLFIIVVIILLVMTGYMLILSNHSNSNNKVFNKNSINGYSYYIVNPNGKLTNFNNSNNVIPDTTSSGTMWVIGIALSYPDVWSPYFDSSNLNSGYSISYTLSNLTYHYTLYYNLVNVSGNGKQYVNGYWEDILIFYVSEFSNSSAIRFHFNLNYLLNNKTITVYTNNLTMPNNDQYITLQGLPYGNVTSLNDTNPVISQELIFNLFYPIKNTYTLKFTGYNSFSVSIIGLNITTNSGNISINLINGTYSYTIYVLNKSYSSNITINGNNIIINVGLSVFLGSPTLDFFTYLILIFIMLITILHFTRGSMIFLSFSSFLFIYIGYKLSIAFFTINLILFFVLIFSALLSYKVFLE